MVCLICYRHFLSEGHAQDVGTEHHSALPIGAHYPSSLATFMKSRPHLPFPLQPVHCVLIDGNDHRHSLFLTLTQFSPSSISYSCSTAKNPDVGFGFDAGKLHFSTSPHQHSSAWHLSSLVWLAGSSGWVRIAQYGLLLAIAALVVIVLFLRSWVVFAMVCVLGVAYNGLILTTVNGLGLF